MRRPEFLDYATMNATSGSWYSLAAIGLRTCVDTDPAAIGHLKHSAYPGRAVSATAPSRLSAPAVRSASTGIRMLIGRKRVPGRLKYVPRERAPREQKASHEATS